MPNQYPGLPPKDELEPWARYYFGLGKTLPAIVNDLKNHYDTKRYSIGRSTLQKWFKEWGLQGTKKQGHTFETIHEPIQQLQQKFPRAGAGQMRHLLRIECDMRVPKEKIAQYNRIVDPEGVRARGIRRLKRRIFYAAGVNHLWAMDQHDKWKKYGLRIHLCTEPYTGKLLWLVVWWTNSNPIYIAGQYFKTVQSLGGFVPCVTQSDLGTENYGVAYAHTTIRHHLDPSLDGTIQHNWLAKHRNIKPESEWSILRNIWSPGFEDMLETGAREGFYNPANMIDSLVFRWIAVPYVQAELDSYLHRHNSTSRRANVHKLLPHGIPDVMYMHPHTVNARDFKVKADPELLARAQAQYAPLDDPVFQLVPPSFQEHISAAYASIGSPAVTFNTMWDVFRELRDQVEATPMSEQAELEIFATVPETERLEDPTPLFKPLRFGEGTIPNLVGEDGKPAHIVDLSDEEVEAILDENSGPEVADFSDDELEYADFTTDEEDEAY